MTNEILNVINWIHQAANEGLERLELLKETRLYKMATHQVLQGDTGDSFKKGDRSGTDLFYRP